MVAETMTVVRKKKRPSGSKHPSSGSNAGKDLDSVSAVNDTDAASEARNSACHGTQPVWKQPP